LGSFLSITLAFASLPRCTNHPFHSAPFIQRTAMSSEKESPALKVFQEHAKNNKLDPTKW
jgi:hypothetical protein